METSPKAPFWPKAAPFALYAVFLCVCLYSTWMKWGDLIVDTGRELNVPAELLSGKVLYRDVPYYFGPLAPYLNCLFYLIGGVQIGSLALAGALSLLLAAWGLHRLAERIAGPWTAFLAVSTFLLVLAFGNYYPGPGIFNFILPYNYPSTYGMAFAVMGVHSFLGSSGRPGRAAWFTPSIWLTLCFLARWEMGLTALLPILIPPFLAFVFEKPRNVRGLQPALAVCGISAGIPAVVYGIFLALAAGGNTGLGQTFAGNVTLSRGFFGTLSGLDNPSRSLSEVLAVCGRYALFALLFAAGGLAASAAGRGRPPSQARVLQALIALPAAAAAYFLFSALFRNFTDQFRLVPPLCLGLSFWAAWNIVRGRGSNRRTALLAISLFAFLALIRVVLRAWAGQYGFYLLIPGLAVYYYFFLECLPSFFKDAAVRLFLRGGFALLSAFFLLCHINLERNFYGLRTLPVSSPRGTLLLFYQERNARGKELVDYLRQHASPQDTLAVFPEGIGINYLTGLKNPLYNFSYLPLDLSAPQAALNVLAQLERFQVNYVAVVQRDTAEYGFAAFGKDYGEGIMDYIGKNYLLDQSFGPAPFTTDHYGIALYKRKNSAAVGHL